MADHILLPGIGLIATKQFLALAGSPHGQLIVLVGPNGEVIPYDAANGYSVDVGRVRTAVAVTGPATNAELRAAAIPVVQSGAAVATYAVVAAAAAQASAVLRAAAAGRKGLIIYNDADTNLRIFYGAGASVANRSYPDILPQGFFEMPGPVPYTGQVTGYWLLTGAGANPTGNARVTELT